MAEVPPLPWRCLRCGERRMFTVRFDDPEEGPVVTLDPPCPTYVDCERNGVGDLHEPNETCPGPEGSPWCPLDGRDDYATGDLGGVLSSVSAYKRGRAEAERDALRLKVREFEAHYGWWDDSDTIRTCGICNEAGVHADDCPMTALGEQP